MKRQATLYDAWKTNPRPAPVSVQPPSKKSRRPLPTSSTNIYNTMSTNQATRNKYFDGVNIEDDDVIPINEEPNEEDEDLIFALEASKLEYEMEQERKRKKTLEEVEQLAGPSTSTTSNTSNRNCNIASTSSKFNTFDASAAEEKYVGFDANAGKFWIYPTNFPIRNYQHEIIKKALFYNTLVTLPTGLGKTFIAAVVMYNFYRWYPNGKVAFMAPTKPLVAQQVEACYNVMGIPQSDVAEMTGSINPILRKRLWNEKRVFFLTPQIINNDLQKNLFEAESVKCLVIDEAHKATGEHAYCQVVRELLSHTKQFRVLALSATPGSDLTAVQQVLSNLLIAHMELRDEDSAEIRQYTHARDIECIVVPLNDDLKRLKQKYEKVLQNWLNVLSNKRVMFATQVDYCTLTSVLAARNRFRVSRPPGISQYEAGYIEGAFTRVIGLLHGYTLLSNMGMKSLYNYFQGAAAGDKSNALRTELSRNADLIEIFDELRDRFQAENKNDSRHRFPSDGEDCFDRSHATYGCTQQVTDMAANSHPKLVKLVEILSAHFKKHADGNTRVMVFAQYRDCVEEITDLLSRQRPLIRSMKFVGQTTSARAVAKGISQKEQLRVVRQFKSGGYNTLVSTSVGEEGLDIGEVDLIVCYDATWSPVRSVQRMGRTGRKRQGKIIVLVAEGREQQIFSNSEHCKKRVHKAIVTNKKFELYRHNQRMVPANITPQCLPMLTSQKDPYNNALLKKREVKGTKRFTGTLSEAELNEWQRDFKTEDFDVKALKQRSKFMVCNETNCGENYTVCLGDYSLWQDRMQPSLLVQPTDLRKSFVDSVQKCQYFSKLPPDTEALEPIESIDFNFDHVDEDFISKKPKKSIQNSKKKNTVVRRSDIYISSTGQRFDLNEIFPDLDEANLKNLRRKNVYEYEEKTTRNRLYISSLTPGHILDAMREFSLVEKPKIQLKISGGENREKAEKISAKNVVGEDDFFVEAAEIFTEKRRDDGNAADMNKRVSNWSNFDFSFDIRLESPSPSLIEKYFPNDDENSLDVIPPSPECDHGRTQLFQQTSVEGEDDENSKKKRRLDFASLL